jgi:hypothetical protein
VLPTNSQHVRTGLISHTHRPCDSRPTSPYNPETRPAHLAHVAPADEQVDALPPAIGSPASSWRGRARIRIISRREFDAWASLAVKRKQGNLDGRSRLNGPQPSGARHPCGHHGGVREYLNP